MKKSFLLALLFTIVSGSANSAQVFILDVSNPSGPNCIPQDRSVIQIIKDDAKRFGDKNVTRMAPPAGYEDRMVWIKLSGWNGPYQHPIIFDEKACYEKELLYVLEDTNKEYSNIRDSIAKEHQISEERLKQARVSKLVPFSRNPGPNGVTYFSHQACPAQEQGWQYGVLKANMGISMEGCWKRRKSKYYLDEIVEFCPIKKDDKGQLAVYQNGCMIGNANSVR